MRNAKLFHDRLAARLAALFGATSLALVYAASGEACGKHPATTATTSTTSGAGGADGGGSTTASGFFDGPPLDADPLEVQCFVWPPAPSGGTTSSGAPDAGTGAASTSAGGMDAGTTIDPATGCPSDATTILTQLDPFNCPAGWEAREVLSPPALNAQKQCCYQVGIHICLGGGRPFSSSEGSLTAAAARGVSRGWSEGRAPNVNGLSRDERTALAHAWTKDALLEHASVASFARFSMALLAAGAPADLVEAAQQASLDEIHHARLCFALASAYAGEEVQPGPFPMGAGLEIDTSLVALATSTIIEGCIGETIAAIRAAEQLARAEDPAVRHALAIIAEDEARHAELAWRTVMWAMKEGGAPVHEAVRRTFAEALDRGGGASEARVEDPWTGLQGHGFMGDASSRAVAKGALSSLVEPAARMLVATNVA